MAGDRAGRLSALRSRIKSRLEEADAASEEDEEVEDIDEIEVSLAVDEEEEPGWWKSFGDSGRIERLRARRERAAATSGTRTAAMWFITIGSLLGLVTGALLLNGHPSDLISSSLFDPPDHADVTGIILEAETSEAVENVSITLYTVDDGTEVRSAVTGQNGFYRMETVKVEPLRIVAVKDGYITVDRIFLPDKSGEDPITMTPGEGTRNEGSVDDLDHSNLQSAVTVGTIVAMLTIAFAFVGLHGAAEAKRGKRYRRTQYLCGVALLSRGFILIGPLLILIGMILMIIAKEQFLDQGGAAEEGV